MNTFGTCKLGTYSYLEGLSGSIQLCNVCMGAIKSGGLVVFDLETTGLEPTYDDILLVSFTLDGVHSYVFNPSKVDITYFLKMLTSCEVANHNIGFDYSFLIAKYPELRDKMKIKYDTMVMMGLAAAGITFKFGGTGLDDVSERYLGIKLDKSVRTNFIKGIWENDTQVSYAAGDALAVWNLITPVSAVLRASGMWHIWEETERPFIPVIAAMCVDGIDFNLEEGIKLRDEYRVLLDDILKRIDDLTKYDDDVEYKCKDCSRNVGKCKACKGAGVLIFGCKVCRSKGTLPKNKGGGTCTNCSGAGKITQACICTEGKCPGCSGKGFNVVRETIHLNPASSQQKIAYFEREGIKVPTKTNDEGEEVKTVDTRNRKKIDHPLIPLLNEFGKVDKLLSGFLVPLTTSMDDDKESGRYNPRDGKVHTKFTQTRTSTGRLSSEGPNLQNIPRDNRIRNLFIAPKGEMVVSTDLSQYEVRVLAEVTEDKKLCEIFEKRQKLVVEFEAEMDKIDEVVYTSELGDHHPALRDLNVRINEYDVHNLTAIAINNLDPSKIDYESKDWKKARSAAKAITFGIPYGAGSQGISQQAEITKDEAQKLLDSYFLRYVELKQWLDKTKSSVRTPDLSGVAERMGISEYPLTWVETIAGRRRFFTLPQTQDRMKRKKEQGSIEREATNHPIQGVNADVIKGAMIAVYNLYSTDLRFQGCVMRLSVHDELVTTCPKDKVKLVAKTQADVMKAMSDKYLKKVHAEVGNVVLPHWSKG